MGKLERRARRKAAKQEPHRGDCTITKKCDQRGGEIFHCITCENLRDAGKRDADKVYTVQTCVAHRDKAIEKIKRHALISHPVNILRVTAAALKGEL